MSSYGYYIWALAKEIPNPDGSESFIPNPHKTWKDVNPELPAALKLKF